MNEQFNDWDFEHDENESASKQSVASATITDLVPLESLTPEIFDGDKLTNILASIRTVATSYAPDISTASGRKSIASLASKVAKSKTAIDGLGKKMVSDWKTKAKGIDVLRKQSRDFLDELKFEVRHPLTAWEENEQCIKAEKEEAARAMNQERVDNLQALNVVISLVDAASLTEDEYIEMREEATAVYDVETRRLALEEAARVAEMDRLEAQRIEQEEQQAKIDAENKRIAEDRAAFEAEQKARQDVIDETNRIEQKKIDDAKAAIETEKKAEQDRKDREEFERQSKIQAEADAKEKVEREAQEAADMAEAERVKLARQESLKPDKEKLHNFSWEINKLGSVVLNLETDQGIFLYGEVATRLMKLATTLRLKADKL